MAALAVQINNMLETLEKEDVDMVISYIQFLSDKRKKEKVEKAKNVIDQVQAMIGTDKGWASEEEMLEDMANFRSS